MQFETLAEQATWEVDATAFKPLFASPAIRDDGLEHDRSQLVCRGGRHSRGIGASSSREVAVGSVIGHGCDGHLQQVGIHLTSRGAGQRQQLKTLDCGDGVELEDAYTAAHLADAGRSWEEALGASPGAGQGREEAG